MTLVSIDEYWQTILNDLTQFGKIETEDLEFNKRSDELWKVLENTLIKIDTEIVVDSWEKNLSLTVPSDSTLFDRKCAILNTLAKREYVPLNIIKRGLEIICGEGNCTFELDKENNKAIVAVSINTSKEQILDVEFLLERILPHDITTEMKWSDGLPMTYKRVDCLGNTGDQYIITDLHATGSMKFELEFITKTWGTLSVLYGVHEDEKKSSSVLYNNYNHQNGRIGRFVYGETYYYPYFNSGSFQLDKKYHMLVEGTNIWRNGEKVKRYTYSSDELVDGVPAEENFVSTLPIALFASNGLLGRRNGDKKIYFFRASDNGVLKLNFIPALDPTGRPCMYDTVSGKPYYNDGNGEFVVGMTVEQVRRLSLPFVDDNRKLVLVLPKEAFVDVLAQEALERVRKNGWELTLVDEDSEIPVLYKRLEYLESTGTQYIDTKYKPNNETGMLVNYKATARTDYMVIGVQDVIDNQTCTLYPIRNDAAGGNVVCWGTQNENYNMGTTIRTYHRWESTLNWRNDRLTTITSSDDGYREQVNLSTLGLPKGTGVIPQLSRSLYFFGRNNQGRIAYRLTGRIYFVKISQGFDIVYNWIPVLDPTGAPCMFDTVSRTPFYNAGTGDFVTPPVGTTTYGLRKRDYAKITEHGIRRLYHVPQGCEMSKEEYAEQNEFKILIETPQPEEGYWIPQWHDREDCIELEWIEAEPPSNEL